MALSDSELKDDDFLPVSDEQLVESALSVLEPEKKVFKMFTVSVADSKRWPYLQTILADAIRCQLLQREKDQGEAIGGESTERLKEAEQQITQLLVGATCPSCKSWVSTSIDRSWVSHIHSAAHIAKLNEQAMSLRYAPRNDHYAGGAFEVGFTTEGLLHCFLCVATIGTTVEAKWEAHNQSEFHHSVPLVMDQLTARYKDRYHRLQHDAWEQMEMERAIRITEEFKNKAPQMLARSGGPVHIDVEKVRRQRKVVVPTEVPFFDWYALSAALGFPQTSPPPYVQSGLLSENSALSSIDFEHNIPGRHIVKQTKKDLQAWAEKPDNHAYNWRNSLTRLQPKILPQQIGKQQNLEAAPLSSTTTTTGQQQPQGSATTAPLPSDGLPLGVVHVLSVEPKNGDTNLTTNKKQRAPLMTVTCWDIDIPQPTTASTSITNGEKKEGDKGVLNKQEDSDDESQSSADSGDCEVLLHITEGELQYFQQLNVCPNVKADVVFCKCCQTNVGRGCWKQHIGGKQHQTKAKQVAAYLVEKTEKQRKAQKLIVDPLNPTVAAATGGGPPPPPPPSTIPTQRPSASLSNKLSHNPQSASGADKPTTTAALFSSKSSSTMVVPATAAPQTKFVKTEVSNFYPRPPSSSSSGGCGGSTTNAMSTSVLGESPFLQSSSCDVPQRTTSKVPPLRPPPPPPPPSSAPKRPLVGVTKPKTTSVASLHRGDLQKKRSGSNSSRSHSRSGRRPTTRSPKGSRSPSSSSRRKSNTPNKQKRRGAARSRSNSRTREQRRRVEKQSRSRSRRRK